MGSVFSGIAFHNSVTTEKPTLTPGLPLEEGSGRDGSDCNFRDLKEVPIPRLDQQKTALLGGILLTLQNTFTVGKKNKVNI